MIARLPILALLLAATLGAEPKRDRHGDPLPDGAVARLGTIQAHPSCKTIAFSADGKTIITTGETTVRFWDVDAGRARRHLTRPKADGTLQAFSRDGRTLGIETGGKLELHDLTQERAVQTVALPRHELSYGLMFSPDGQRAFISIGTIGGKWSAFIVDVATGNSQRLAGAEQAIRSGVFSHEGRHFAGEHLDRADDDSIRFWDIGSGKLIGAHYGDAYPLAVMPEGNRLLVTAIGKGTCEWMDAVSGRRQPIPRFPSLGERAIAAVSPDGRLLAVNTARDITIWDVSAGKVLHQLPGGARALAFSPDGKRLAAADDLVRLFDVESGKSLWPDFGPMIGRNDHLGHLFTRQAGKLIATWNASQRIANVWDLTTGKPVFTTTAVGRWCHAIWLSADGRRLHLCTERRAQSWDIASGKELRRISPVPAELIEDDWQVVNARESSNGLSILLCRPVPDGVPARMTVVRWDASDGRLLDQRSVIPGVTRFATFAPGNDALLSRDRRIDLQTGRQHVVAMVPAGYRAVSRSILSDDGRFLAGHIGPIGGKSTEVTVWEAATGRVLLRAPTANDERPELAFSPDNRWLAIGGDSAIEFWDLATGAKAKLRLAHAVPDTTPGDGNNVLGLMFLPGRRLIAGYRDWTALVWELPAEMATPSPHRIGERTWDHLAAIEPPIAQEAVWALTNEPPKALALLERIKPATRPSDAELAPTIADLDAADFPRREAAARRLREYGHTIEKALEAEAPRPASAERAKRLKRLLDELRDDGPVTADERRAVRAVQALEQIGNADARSLLESWAKGADTATLMIESRQALKRCADTR